MKQEGKRCYSCGYFKAYYTRGYCCLAKQDIGYCCQHKKITERTEGCDKWFCRRIPREKRIRLAVNSLPEIYKKISVIEQMLKDDAEIMGMIEKTDNGEN